MKRFTILYPQPTDTEKFDKEYEAHVRLFHEANDIPLNPPKYTIVKTQPGLDGKKPPYYAIFSMASLTEQELNKMFSNPRMGELMDDILRVSTGGPPTFLIGEETHL